MSDRLLLFLVLFPLLSVSGVALVWIGLSGLREARGQEERERTRTTGTVVEIKRRTSLGRGKPLFRHYPVVEFTADGRTQRHESRADCWPGRLEVGERVDLLYNADDPGAFHLDKLLEKQIAGDRATVLAGILWIAAAGVVAMIVSR